MKKEFQKVKDIGNSYSDNTSLKAVVNLIPYVGGALDEIFSHRSNSLKNKRLENFISNTENVFQDIEENKLNKSFLESDEFTDLVLRCIRLSIKTTSNDKAKIFSQIIKKSLTVKAFNLEEFEEIESLLEQISYREFLYLQELDTWIEKLDNDYFKMLKYANERAMVNGANFPKYNSFFHAFCEYVSDKLGLSIAEIQILEKTCNQKGLVEQSELNYSTINQISAARNTFGYSMKIKPTLLYKHLTEFIGKI